MLSIKNLKASLLDGTQILKGINLDVKPGEVHAIMGINGSGKSTLAKVISGHPAYQVDEGSVELDGKNLLELEPNERANEGFFASTQYPIEIPGVPNVEFLRMAVDSKRAYLKEGPISDEEFSKRLNEAMALLEMDDRYRTRGLNDGFSGGEKKRNEILQMAMLLPKYSFLDETDSGLDIDALRIVSNGINHLHNQNRAVILVTHYERILDLVKPDFIHVLMHGKILMSGGPELALKLEKDGYDWIEGA
ncbi:MULTISPECIES: Fe-S cluster assembly ATPase SufC [Hallerella]|uniref:Fe-S cluster assembly ATPase SufC n=1 Tax=Hallerella TaxID=2815788 RepID=UPI000D0E2A02|nr:MULTISPECIES: Fe-S cluster assembly ATPase SufC [Hallerella]MCI6873093.1 Fe-S cluster assembly ATPase SufC [Hallerella sp.]MDD6091567.1 Fe-S cluster assembly ATPase SufC [Hallerella succinigenes]MDY5029358.1 Fe-S cluster assembly ATPase SufC [Hallerella succinigenes]